MQLAERTAAQVVTNPIAACIISLSAVPWVVVPVAILALRFPTSAPFAHRPFQLGNMLSDQLAQEGLGGYDRGRPPAAMPPASMPAGRRGKKQSGSMHTPRAAAAAAAAAARSLGRGHLLARCECWPHILKYASGEHPLNSRAFACW
eukprot:SAG31_NODE_1712_length_7468_cov_8.329896_1_plen_147_part_00